MLSKIFLLVAVSILYEVACQDHRGAIWMPSPHVTYGRRGHKPRYLIIHGTAGGSSARNIGSWFQNPNSKVSAHYTVDKRGVIVQSVRERDAAWANGRIESGADYWWRGVNPNYITISIEHVKARTDNSDQITSAQLAASIRLAKGILARNPGIKAVKANGNTGITGHFSISPKSRARCPGPFPFDKYISALGGRSGGGSSSGRCVGTITASSLYIRASPNTRSKINGYLFKGATVYPQRRVSGQSINGNTGWYYISTGSKSGYISAFYVRVRSGSRPSWCN